jgi:hypothetical protein
MFAVRFVKLGPGHERVTLSEPAIADEAEFWLAVVAGRALLGRGAPDADGFQVFD